MNIIPDLRSVFDNYVRHYLFENGIFKYLIDGEIKSTEINIQKTVKKLGDYEIYQFNSFGKIAGGSILFNSFNNDIGIIYGFNCGGQSIISYVGVFPFDVENIIETDTKLSNQNNHLLCDLTELETIMFANQILSYLDFKQVTSKKSSNLILVGLYSLSGMDLFELPDYGIPIERYTYYCQNYKELYHGTQETKDRLAFESSFYCYLRNFMNVKGFESFLVDYDLGQVIRALRIQFRTLFNNGAVEIAPF